MEQEITRKDYEIAFLSAEETGGEEVRKLVAQHGGEILLDNPAERIALSYKIGKDTSAYFGFLHFAAAPAAAKAMEHDLNTNTRVLRFLLITPPFVKAKPKPGKPNKPKAPEAAVEQQRKPVESLPLSNEALEKKIEEILQQ